MKSLCHGSMKAGRAAAAAAEGPILVACARCGQVFRSVRLHTAQVPRHLPPARPVTLHRRPCVIRPARWDRVARVSDPASSPVELPAYIAVGDLLLERAGGDFPDELVYVTIAGSYRVWVKSQHLTDGPWDWIVCLVDGSPIDFRGPFATLEAVIADLAPFLDRSRIVEPAAPRSELRVIPAASRLEPRPTAFASVGARTGAVGLAEVGDDAEIAIALDLAMAALRRLRSRVGASAESRA
jgi:hypothetical protein